MVERKITLSENGTEYYTGNLSVNECYFRGRIFKDVKAPEGKAPAKFTIQVSNGKKKDSEEWNAPTFVNCLAWNDLGKQIADRYVDKDEIEVIAKYMPHSYNGTIYPEFLVREVIRMKPEQEPENPYPNATEQQTNDSNDAGTFEEIPSDDDLPF
jgi:hypothetical protein